MDQQGFDDMSLTPGTASESAERYVRALIFWGELGPGDRLPPATEFAAQLGISRVTLRIALRSLESMGYLVTTRGAHGGSRVSDLQALQKCWAQWMGEHSGELDDIFEFRITVERRLAELAALRRTAGDLEAMELALAEERDNRRRASLFRADAGIHRSISAAAHSPRLALAMNAVQRRPLPARRSGPARQHRGRRLRHARGHRRSHPRPGPGARVGRSGDSRPARPPAPDASARGLGPRRRPYLSAARRAILRPPAAPRPPARASRHRYLVSTTSPRSTSVCVFTSNTCGL